MKEGHARYFVALVPPEPVYAQTWEWKEWFRNQYDTHKALNSPPHITLQMPFHWREDREERLPAVMKPVAEAHQAFALSLPGFAAFPPRVIYLDVAKSEPLFTFQKSLTRQLRRELGIHHATHKNNGFVPHLTVAFRDLKKEAFTQAWQEVQEKTLDYTWQQTNVTLLKHDGQRWQRHIDIDLAE